MSKPAPTFAQDPKAALELYLENGCHIEPDVWTQQECEALRAASQKLPPYLAGDRKPVMQPHRTDEIYLRAMKNPKIVKIMEYLLNGKVSAIQTEFFYGMPGTSGFGMHQDNFYVHAKPDAFGSAWSALQDVAVENGGLILYPGSQKEGLLPVEEYKAENVHQDPNANKVRPIVPDKYKPVDVIVKAGSCVFIHSEVLHNSHKNVTKDRTRNVLLMTYIRRGESFRAGNYAKRSEVDVYSGDSSVLS